MTMENSSIKTHDIEEEETESWVYSYTDQCATPSEEGCACKIVTSTPTSKYNSSLLQETLNSSSSEHSVLATSTNTFEVERQGNSIAFKIGEKGADGHEMRLRLNLKDACVVMGLLAQAIEEVSSTVPKQ